MDYEKSLSTRYREAGLEQFFKIIRRRLSDLSRTVIDEERDEGLIQTIPEAYREALRLAPEFRKRVLRIAKTLQCKTWSCRPGNGVKDAHRILEKAAKFGVGVPRDILGAKFVVQRLSDAYETAALFAHWNLFHPVFFEDRFLNPQPSGYRDLKFEVRFHGLIVEVKICHALMDEADSIEHKIYEIVRVLQQRNRHTRTRLNPSELIVLEELDATSKKLYATTWERVLELERG
jgi:ppGpp synthetase/RelA/SpoT-type nucleotidyltranferase